MPGIDLSAGLLDPTPRRTGYDDIIERESRRTGIDSNLIRAVMGQESGGNPLARSPKGAQGLMQLMPATAQRFGAQNPTDPEQNIHAGTEYLRFLVDRYKGDINKVLAGYNAGEGAVDKFGGIPPYQETRSYVPAVKARYQRLSRQTPGIDLSAGLEDSEQNPPPVKTENTPATGQPSAPIIHRGGSIFGRPEVRRAVRAEQKRQQREAAKNQPPETIDAGPSGSVEIDPNTMGPVPAPAMQARTPSYWERLKEAVAPYVPGLSTLDTPGGVKTDVLRGAVSGVTLGYAGDPRQVSREEQILDPQAQQRANIAHTVGEYGSMFLPYVGAEKAVGTVIKGSKLASRAARTGVVFGGVEAARQGVNAIRGRQTNLAEIPKAAAVGAVSGGLMGEDPGVLRRVGSLVAPQAAEQVIEGAPPEQIATSAVTNTLFGLMGGGKLEDGLVESPVKTEPPRREITPKPPPSREALDQRIASEAEGRDRAAIRQEFDLIKQQEPAPEPVHHSQFQPRRVRGEGKGQFKKGKPVIPEATDASTIRSNEEIVQEISPTSVGEGSEIPRSENVYRAGGQPVDQIAPSEVLTRRQAEPEKTPPQINAPSNERLVTGERSDISLSQFVRKRGGIAPAEMYKGELNRLRKRETGTTGLINQNARQGNVKQTADILMRDANDAGFRDKDGQPFTNPGDFLRAVERDVAGERTMARSGAEPDWDAELRKYEAQQQTNIDIANRDADARVVLLENDQSGQLYDKITEGRANESDIEQFRQHAKAAGLSDAGTEDLIASARSSSIEETPTVQAAPSRESQYLEIPALTRKSTASVEPPITRAPLQVRAAVEPIRPPTLQRAQAERSFPKSAEAAGLPAGDNLKYDPITNEESLAKADQRIKQVGVDRAASEIAMRKEASADDVATGIRLMQTFTQAGQHERAADVASDLAEKLTKAGQSVQAASVISRLSPEGVLLTAQRQLPAGKKLTAVQSEGLVEQAKTVQQAEARIADLEKRIADMQTQAKSPSKSRVTQKIGTLEDRLVKLETEARARLEARKQQAQQLGPQAGASTIPLDIADYAIVGAAKIARKGMSTAKWTAEMVSEFGEEIRPHLQKIYRESYSIYDDHRKQMKAEAEQRSIQRENPNAPAEDLNRLIQERAAARKDARTARAQMARLFNDLTATPWSRTKAIAGDVLNIPRTLKASVDLSAPRQGAMWILNHPIEGAKTFFGRQIKAMREVNYDKFVDQLESDPDYALMTRSGLALTTTDSRVNALTAREEAFMSRLAGKIPGVSHSERAYTTFLDTARSSWFKQLKNVAEMKAQSENRQITPEEYQAIANFVNIATGRGNLGKGWLNNTSPFLNAVFFAPKFAASKVQIFDPRVYAKLPVGARRQAMREAVSYFGAMATTALLLKYGFNKQVGTNPEDSEFMKLRVGNTRYDLANGTGQYVVLAARLLRNAENKRTGQKDKQGKSLQENLDRFLRYKYSPPAGFARNVWEGKNAIGEKTNLKKESIEAIVPLFGKDLFDAYKEEGLTGLAKTSPGFVGVGVQTYGDKKKK